MTHEPVVDPIGGEQPDARYAVVVLAGGAAVRMGGVPKPELTVGGRSLLRRVMDAAPQASPRVVVGDVLGRGFIVTIEDPPGGGPAYALRAGLAHIPSTVPLVLVLAADLPFLTPQVVEALCAASDDRYDGAVLVDHHGRPQWLCGVWRQPVLRDRLADCAPGTGMRQVLGTLRYAEVGWFDSDLPAWFDCDTPDSLEYARRLEREFRAR
ncbi:molybdopterin-guanine dinucleotide biosynthesis protein A [Stackebrandtia albiflava]|uniref:Molybdopterin-guanine dinucleotide biosynthesis protein A n=1 Tax=Stackebrandtia albiflava TaxID=406432 RepID=A0A562V144_9ACTN|nr:molybdopterin-guanine dinucleotide biosynthesis protein A [Stackebrandtia albiflava]